MDNVDDVSGLKSLGSKKTEYKDEVDSSILETFPNKFPDRDYEIKFYTEEFTSKCPKTGQPDFGKITITYVADKQCIETKSLKLYLFSYRNTGAFMESIVNQILQDLVSVSKPRKMTVFGDFNPRGGITIQVEVKYHEEIRAGTITKRMLNQS